MKLNNWTTMKGFIEIKEDSFEDTVEHLHKIKSMACKLIKKLSEHSEMYDRDREEEYDDEEEFESRGRGGRRNRGRYGY